MTSVIPRDTPRAPAARLPRRRAGRAPSGALALLALTLALLLAAPRAAQAGPPFTTDDPEPVGYRNWEVYIASQLAQGPESWAGTGPHLEVNYGPTPDTQLHVIVPLAWSAPARGGDTQVGLGDLELGVKARFVRESRGMPQIGTFVLVLLPTGNAARGLGAGRVQYFFPLWVQKSWGPWTMYGGGGVWVVPGANEFDRGFLGWHMQRKLGPHLTLGADVFCNFPGFRRAEPGVDAGAIVNVTDSHHILFSAGAWYGERAMLQAYLAYQLTFGPGGPGGAEPALPASRGGPGPGAFEQH